jgi:8-oxo-dGTP pyrophosphatase MutT (NUDIX family)
MTAIRDSIVPAKNVTIRAAAGLIFTEDGHYLLQCRDNNPEIAFPDELSLFGGRVKKSEGPAEGLRRELREELELEAGAISYFSQIVYDAILGDGTTHQRYYFEVPIDISIFNALILHEGAGMRLMGGDDIAREFTRIIPYDLAFVRLHMRLRQARALGAGAGKIR